MSKGQWVEVAPKTEGQCSYGGCTEQATWRRKEGWMVAPGSPEGDVCEDHHCWEPIQFNPNYRACGLCWTLVSTQDLTRHAVAVHGGRAR